MNRKLVFCLVLVTIATCSLAQETVIGMMGKDFLCRLYKSQETNINSRLKNFEEVIKKIKAVESNLKSLVTEEAMKNKQALENTKKGLNEVIATFRALRSSRTDESVDSLIDMITKALLDRLESFNNTFEAEYRSNPEPFKPNKAS